MKALEHRLTEKEWNWIKVYFEAQGNTTEATKRVYGGTPGACRVKGHKKSMKFKPILEEIAEREFYLMQYRGISGIDFYLGDLERRVEEDKRFWEGVGDTKGFFAC